MLWKCTKEGSALDIPRYPTDIDGVSFGRCFTVSLRLSAPPPSDGSKRIVLAQGSRSGVVQWELQADPSRRLELLSWGAVTGVGRISTRYGYGDKFRVDLTDPRTGRITLAALGRGEPLCDAEAISLTTGKIDRLSLGAHLFSCAHSPLGWKYNFAVLQRLEEEDRPTTQAETIANFSSSVADVLRDEESADLHWQAMLGLAVNGTGFLGPDGSQAYALQAGNLVNAHEDWKRGGRK